jgi:hypothetical protein
VIRSTDRTVHVVLVGATLPKDTHPSVPRSGEITAATFADFAGIGMRLDLSTRDRITVRTEEAGNFELLPKFDQIFSGDGKTTYQMKDIRPGRYVGIIYDQRALGIRHADQIYLLTNRNDRIRRL